MKKTIIILILSLFLTGCNKEEKQTPELEYLITYNSIEIKPGTFFSNVIATLGEYNNVYEEPSSYTEGTTSVYEYDTFSIETYIDNNIEKIYSITITSDEQLTDEGIKIGDNISQMKQAYGLNYINPIENLYIYNIENTNISFATENDIIIGIVYYLT